MSRPRKCRKVCHFPPEQVFLPEGCCEEKKTVTLTVDEYETIRLIDREGMSQEQCSESMNIARTTVQQIYACARKKLADMLVEGLPLRIGGGEYRLYDGACEGRAGDSVACEGNAGDGVACEGNAGDGAAYEGRAGDSVAREGNAGDGTACEGRAGDGAAYEGRAGDSVACGGAGDGNACEGDAGDDVGGCQAQEAGALKPGDGNGP